MYDFDPKKDYYKILWISEDASKDDVKKAFKKLAVKHHPDKWWKKEDFQEINEAYQVLFDDQKRQQYDMIRKWWGWFWWFWEWWFDIWWFWGSWWFDVWDIFQTFFWWWYDNRWWNKQNNLWSNMKIQISISFEEAFLWTKKKVSYQRKVLEKWISKKTCTKCNWRWNITKTVQTPFWMMQTKWACPKCWWTWQILEKNWKELDNWGFIEKKEIIEVKIPSWISNWVYIKYPNKWNEWIDWTWNLYVKINIKESKIYERKWNDLYVNIDINVFDLVLWWVKQINHPEWKIKVKIPKWTQINEYVKVSWKWFKWWRWILSSNWDMYLNLNLKIPKRLTKEQEKLWKKLSEL